MWRVPIPEENICHRGRACLFLPTFPHFVALGLEGGLRGEDSQSLPAILNCPTVKKLVLREWSGVYLSSKSKRKIPQTGQENTPSIWQVRAPSRGEEKEIPLVGWVPQVWGEKRQTLAGWELQSEGRKRKIVSGPG